MGSGTSGLLHAKMLDRESTGTELVWKDVESWKSETGKIWIHLDRKVGSARVWLREKSGIDMNVVRALLVNDPRPRSFRHGDGLLVILRGVNLNPGAQPDDMISVRLWIDSDRVVSLRSPKIKAVNELANDLKKGAVFTGTGEFFGMLAVRMCENMIPVVDNLEKQLEIVREDAKKENEGKVFRERLFELRRQAVSLRRYIAPQRDVLHGMLTESIPWLTEDSKSHIREAAELSGNFVEDLDETLAHAQNISDNVEGFMAEQLNRRLYLMTIIAAIFLPLNMITSLLGINVTGIPMSDNKYAFAGVCGILLIIAVIQIMFFWRKKWL